MKKEFFQFSKNLLLLTLLIALLSVSLGYIFPILQLPKEASIVFTFFFSITLLVHFILLKADRKSDSHFIRYFMAATMLKLFLYLTFIISLIFLLKEHAKPLSILFMILYLVYSIFEVGSFLGHIKKRKIK